MYVTEVVVALLRGEMHIGVVCVTLVVLITFGVVIFSARRVRCFDPSVARATGQQQNQRVRPHLARTCVTSSHHNHNLT